jgi:DNA-binding MurR/RpiR family transcriptional regulator
MENAIDTVATEDNVLVDLRRNYQDLTLAQKRIAELIVEDPEFVAFATVDKLSGRLGVSPSTVVRFAYRLGLNGYPDLQSRIREIVRSQMRPSPGDDVGQGHETEHLGQGTIARSLSHDIDNVRRTVSRLSLVDFENAVDLLVGARWVYVAGGFASDSLAQYVVFALGRMRGRASVLNGGKLTPAALMDITENDTILAFSFPPYASRTLEIVQTAKSAGANVVAVTDALVAPIAQLSDVVLAVNVSGIGPQNSLLAPMAVANALLNVMFERIPEAPQRYDRLFGMMNEWNSFLLHVEDE